MSNYKNMTVYGTLDSNHRIVGSWNMRRAGDNRVQITSTYTWKKNYWIDAYLITGTGQIEYDNPKNVPIPNYVRKEVTKFLMYGASFYRLVQLQRGFAVSLWLDMPLTVKYNRPSYTYNVATPPFDSYPNGVVFFDNQFCPAPSDLGDKDKMIDALLFWLCLREGDTGQEYFDRYTSEQLAWSRSWKCEEMSAELSDIDS